jgi:hypothetical protein
MAKSSNRTCRTRKALQNMLGHESAGLTLDRYGHLYGSDVEAVGVAINDLLTRKCGQNVLVEPRGFEPLTSALQRQRSTN